MGLGMKAFGNPTFASVIQSLYGIVKKMVGLTRWGLGKELLLVQIDAGRLEVTTLRMLHLVFGTMTIVHLYIIFTVTLQSAEAYVALVELKQRGWSLPYRIAGKFSAYYIWQISQRKKFGDLNFGNNLLAVWP